MPADLFLPRLSATPRIRLGLRRPVPRLLATSRAMVCSFDPPRFLSMSPDHGSPPRRLAPHSDHPVRDLHTDRDQRRGLPGPAAEGGRVYARLRGDPLRDLA